jgi:hypothetical protein
MIEQKRRGRDMVQPRSWIATMYIVARRGVEEKNHFF